MTDMTRDTDPMSEEDAQRAIAALQRAAKVEALLEFAEYLTGLADSDEASRTAAHAYRWAAKDARERAKEIEEDCPVHGRAERCAVTIGVWDDVCPCALPLGHEGLHACKHDTPGERGDR